MLPRRQSRNELDRNRHSWRRSKHQTVPPSSPPGDVLIRTGWIPVPSASLAFGPIYLTHSSSSSSVPPICIALQPTTGRVYAFTLPSTTTTSTELALLSTKLEDLEEREALLAAQSSGFTIDDNVGPTDVHHVWVCTRVVDTEDKVTLRSGTGKFLACDEVGAVSAEREARGMQEEWTLHDAPEGGVAIKSAYGKFLSVDILAGGKVELRADEEEEGVGERWRILMQGEFLAKAKKSKIERSGIKSSSVAEGLTIVGSLGNAENDYMYVLFIFCRVGVRTDVVWGG